MVTCAQKSCITIIAWLHVTQACATQWCLLSTNLLGDYNSINLPMVQKHWTPVTMSE